MADPAAPAAHFLSSHFEWCSRDRALPGFPCRHNGYTHNFLLCSNLLQFPKAFPYFHRKPAPCCTGGWSYILYPVAPALPFFGFDSSASRSNFFAFPKKCTFWDFRLLGFYGQISIEKKIKFIDILTIL